MKNLETVEQFNELRNNGKHIFMFLPDIEANYNEYTFVHIDRDQFIDLCVELNVFGIPSFIAFDEGRELGRFVSKDRKTQEDIEQFIDGLK